MLDSISSNTPPSSTISRWQNGHLSGRRDSSVSTVTFLLPMEEPAKDDERKEGEAHGTQIRAATEYLLVGRLTKTPHFLLAL